MRRSQSILGSYGARTRQDLPAVVDLAARGVINYPVRELGLCAGITDAKYVTTTEVYPDSPRATPQQCDDAQVAAVRAALDYALAHR